MGISRSTIDHFLALKRIAMVGVSRKEGSYSRHVWKLMRERGYELIPVNPNAESIDGVAAVKRIADIDPPPEGVMLTTPAAQATEVVKQALASGVAWIWFCKFTSTPEALQLAQAAQCQTIYGECPIMFLDGTGFPHSWHRMLRTITFNMPR